MIAMQSLMIPEKPLQVVLTTAAAVVALSVSWLLVSYFRSPLRQYPGPFLARWTNFWRLYQVYTQKYQWTIKALHDKHGPIVRIGPNLLDLDCPELIKTIYSTDGKWRKTEFYHNNSAIIEGKITYHLFSETDPAAHARMKRPVVKYYSLSSVLTCEPQMSRLIGDFCGHLERRFMDGENKGKDADLGEWIAFYTWDFVSAMTFSKRFGYMDMACDFDRTIHIADQAIDYFAMVGQMPFLDFLLNKNPVKRIGPPNLDNVTRIALENLVARMQDPTATEKAAEARDFLDHFLAANAQAPDVVDDKMIMTYLLINLIAGADTTAITLRAIFDFLLQTPRVLRCLEEEVLAAGFDPAMVASYSAARALPYLEAVVRESMRLHPGVGLLLERYVPDAGLGLPDGSFVPPGVAVGINPYVVGRNRTVWGADADTFRPERWLQAAGEDAAAFHQRLRAMNAADLTFGGGSRICIGRNIALLEVYKVVATLISRYQILPADAPYNFKIVSSWFPRQSGLVCKLAKRA